MKTENKKVITVSVIINAPVKKVWSIWTDTKHIVRWNYASDDWHTTKAENDLRTGGLFSSRMEAKDGSMGFDFWGKYTLVDTLKQIKSTLGDGRKVEVKFISQGETTLLEESFEAESENTLELQKNGWQAILNNFKKYTESPALTEN